MQYLTDRLVDEARAVGIKNGVTAIASTCHSFNHKGNHRQTNVDCYFVVIHGVQWWNVILKRQLKVLRRRYAVNFGQLVFVYTGNKVLFDVFV